METSLSAVELTGTINELHQIQLDEPLPSDVPKRVRVIVLFAVDDEEPTEKDWLRAAWTNTAFDFLSDTDEDIYTLDDGEPLAQ